MGLGVFCPWLLAVLYNPAGTGVDPDKLVRYGPALLLLYCVVNVVFSSHERAIYYTPAEVQMLFAGPFGRREVLAYKILLTLLVSLPATLFMGAVVRVRQGWPPAVLAGLFLIAVFMQLFSMALALLGTSLGAHLFSRGRKVVAGLALVLVLAALAQAAHAAGGWDLRPLVKRIVDADVWRMASLPLRSFFEAMLAERFWPDLLVPLLMGLAVNAVLAGMVFALEGHYQEASAAASSRIYARLQRMRGRSIGAEGGHVSSAPSRLRAPDLPWWGGVGPIFWRQLTAALRGVRRLVIVLCILAALLSVPFLGSALDQEETLGVTAAGLGVWLSIFLTALVPFDFRGDIDRIGALKTLPIAPWPLVIGQLLTPVLMLTLLQWLALGVALAASPASSAIILALAAFAPVFNFVLVALENLLFLLFPIRLTAATPGDFQAMGRNVLLSLGKVIGLGVVAGVAALVGTAIAVLTGNLWLGVAAGWPVVACAGAALVPLVALAFEWFDAGRDMPA